MRQVASVQNCNGRDCQFIMFTINLGCSEKLRSVSIFHRNLLNMRHKILEKHRHPLKIETWVSSSARPASWRLQRKSGRNFAGGQSSPSQQKQMSSWRSRGSTPHWTPYTHICSCFHLSCILYSISIITWWLSTFQVCSTTTHYTLPIFETFIF